MILLVLHPPGAIVIGRSNAAHPLLKVLEGVQELANLFQADLSQSNPIASSATTH
jgi:hypothetical protein